MPNRLADETSPYLAQHADNPVDWYPWCDAAFERARKEDKPVLLSVGYSACHWCHVMAHESFEDERTAEVMNRLFVNIKVDREERPDIDKIYQLAHQLIAQRPGGWPLTMFIDPSDQRPFYGGTYFPPEMRHGMPPFTEVLEKVAEYYAEQREEVRSHAGRIAQIFNELTPDPADEAVTLDRAPLDRAREHFETTFDRHHGGFGSAPKFPHPTTIDRLLRHWRASANDDEPDLEALFMATLTLKRMADGGIFDHLGGGFCRYSVDRYWHIPHFEKMLYDNGPLLALYAQAHIATGENAFAEVAHETADWMLSDMRADDGGFFSSRDADSEGEEGKYYVWTQEEVRELLGTDEYIAFSLRYGLDQPANFERHWHLVRRMSISEVAKERGVTTKLIADRIAAAKRKLIETRSRRVAPARDEKRLTSWNALAIRGLAIAGRALERDDLLDAAAAAADFIHEHLFRDGRLLASFKDGRARFTAYLDDYAFLVDALLELLQARWSASRLEFARALADCLLEHFEDTDDGGFWFTADDHEGLMHRLKPLADDALPSGNGIAALALNRLGCLLGDTRYLESAERTLRAGWKAMAEYPHGHVSLLNALEEYLDEPEIVIIRGDADEAARWNASAAKLYAPRRLVFAIPRDEDALPGALTERRAVEGDTVAYRCVGTHCELPVTSFEALAGQMRGI